MRFDDIYEDLWPQMPDELLQYEVFSFSSTYASDPHITWAISDDYAKAEAVYDLLATHGQRHGVGYVAILDNRFGTVMKSNRASVPTG